jgi:hypothetical protein
LPRFPKPESSFKSSQFLIENNQKTSQPPKNNKYTKMKFTSLLLAASTVASTQAQGRGLQSLAQKWNITDPIFTYDGLHFDLDYQVTDFINDNMVIYSVWNRDCQEGGISVSNTVLSSSKEPLTGDAYAAGGGAGERMLAIDVELEAATITTDPNIYSEDTTPGSVTAQIDFCVRFSLQTDTAPNEIEVNFLETLVTLYVDLSDGFEIGEVSVAPKIKVINTANQVYLIDGYQCDAGGVELDEAALAATRNQGSVIKVCVEPDQEARDSGIFMRSIDSFTFIRSDVDPEINQPAITGPNTASNNGLTAVTCSRGDLQCSFETILFAAFYASPGTVGGEGVGSMQFGNTDTGRRGLRALQADEPAASSEFNLDFGINPIVETQNSGAASSSRVMAATVLMVAGAFTML